MSRPFLVLFHEDESPPGLLAEWFGARGLPWELAGPGDVPADPSAYRAVVSLGSTDSANGPAPWVEPELAFVQDALADDVPVLGLCFGSQLLARAAGGAVAVTPPGEFGWIRPEPVDGVDAGPITALPWFCWHDDAVTVPPGAELLARSPLCPQAYALGPHLGIQFHPEVDAATIGAWMRHRAEPKHPHLDLGPTVEQNEVLLPALRERAFALFDWWLERLPPEPEAG